MKCNGVKQVNSAPYHPSSNGLAERAVQIVKRGLKKTTHGSMKSRIAKVLFDYRTPPHCTTGSSPAKLLLGRQLRTQLDLLKPSTTAQVESKQLNQKICHDNSVQLKQFEKGQSVVVCVYGQQYKWTRGTILRSTGPVSYMVRLSNGLTWRHHQDQLKSYSETKSVSPNKLPETVPKTFLLSHQDILPQNLQTPCPHKVQSLQHLFQFDITWREQGNLRGSIHRIHILTLNLIIVIACTFFLLYLTLN